MNRTFSILCSCLTLAACSPREVALADGRCSTLQVGDRVEGVATLHAYASEGCLHCGAWLERAGCAGEIGYSHANAQVASEYERIIRDLPAEGDAGWVSGRVFVSGEIIRMEAMDEGGSPLLAADAIRTLESDK